MAKRPMPRPSRAPAASKKPTPRPSTAEERAAAERGDRAARREAGMKAGGKVKKMRAGGDAQMRTARAADQMRERLEARDSRPARQEAEYQEAQQRRREAGGIGRLAMIPEAVRRAQVRAGDRMLRGAEARETAPMRAELAAADRAVTDTLGRKAGGKVTKKAAGGKVKKMQAGGTPKLKTTGGVARGMGAATKGGKFSRG